ncbi:hypothetical protein G9A89_004271, partial [Geosiphon pyriformis]
DGRCYWCSTKSWPWSSYEWKRNVANKLLAAHQRMEGEECCQQTPCGTPEDGRSIWYSTKSWPWSSYEWKRNVANKPLAAHQRMEGLSGVQRKVGCGLLMNRRAIVANKPLAAHPMTEGLSGVQRKRNVANKPLAAHQMMEGLTDVQRKVGRGLLMNRRGMLPTNLLRHTRGWKVYLVFNEKLAVRNVANKLLAAHQMMEGLSGVQRKVGRGLLINGRGMLLANSCGTSGGERSRRNGKMTGTKSNIAIHKLNYKKRHSAFLQEERMGRSICRAVKPCKEDAHEIADVYANSCHKMQSGRVISLALSRKFQISSESSDYSYHPEPEYSENSEYSNNLDNAEWIKKQVSVWMVGWFKHGEDKPRGCEADYCQSAIRKVKEEVLYVVKVFEKHPDVTNRLLALK